MQFPKDFVWGAATAAFQIEGATGEDGRGPCIWDRFCQVPGKVINYDDGDPACDHYHRFKDDVALMKNLGLQSYRFSIAWPRIMPTGAGTPNQKGIDFYRRLAEELLSQGIKPVATLYHWDLPMGLQYRGGWANREIAYRLNDYAATMFRSLGDLVSDWTTINEPLCISWLGYGTGVHAPGYQDPAMAVRASHHLLLAHGLAVDSFRTVGPKHGRIGITFNMSGVDAATDSVADKAAAYRYDGWHHRWFFDPVFKGSYPADMMDWYSRFEPLDYIEPPDLAIISRPVDFVGINYYTRAIIKANPENPIFGGESLAPTAPVTDQNWEIVPSYLHQVISRIPTEWTDLPLYIHENGCAMPDAVNEQGQVEDTRRVEYIRDHLKVVHQLVSEGVNLKGYYVWSLLDNFEWAWGYEKRFGIVWVDYKTQQRIPKASALWYAKVIRNNGFEV